MILTFEQILKEQLNTVIYIINFIENSKKKL